MNGPRLYLMHGSTLHYAWACSSPNGSVRGREVDFHSAPAYVHTGWREGCRKNKKQLQRATDDQQASAINTYKSQTSGRTGRLDGFCFHRRGNSRECLHYLRNTTLSCVSSPGNGCRRLWSSWRRRGRTTRTTRRGSSRSWSSAASICGRTVRIEWRPRPLRTRSFCGTRLSRLVHARG